MDAAKGIASIVCVNRVGKFRQGNGDHEPKGYQVQGPRAVPFWNQVATHERVATMCREVLEGGTPALTLGATIKVSAPHLIRPTATFSPERRRSISPKERG